MLKLGIVNLVKLATLFLPTLTDEGFPISCPKFTAWAGHFRWYKRFQRGDVVGGWVWEQTRMVKVIKGIKKQVEEVA